MKTLLSLNLYFISLIVFSQNAPIKVLVQNFQKSPLAGEQVIFAGKTNNTKIKGVSDGTGRFEISLPGGDTYDIRLKSIGDASHYHTIEIPKLGSGQRYQHMEITITMLPVVSYTLKNVNFSSGSSVLPSRSYSELADLVEMMKYKPNQKLIIEGHTDNTGDAVKNQALSLARAESMKSYLVKHGISDSRISTVGYGDTKPIADNSTAEGRSKNRRTEIKFLN